MIHTLKKRDGAHLPAKRAYTASTIHKNTFRSCLRQVSTTVSNRSTNRLPSADCVPNGRVVKSIMTFEATWRPAGGRIRVEIVSEDDGWLAYSCTEPAMPVVAILEEMADLGAIEKIQADYPSSKRWVCQFTVIKALRTLEIFPW
jgi:hypothetical protein